VLGNSLGISGFVYHEVSRMKTHENTV
jgi:hypothetical protein